MRLLRSRVTPVIMLASALCLLAALAPSLRAATEAGPVSVVTRSIALSTSQARAARSTQQTLQLPIHANLIGASWTGRADHLEIRARGGDNRWSAWVPLEGSGDGPDPSSREARAQRGRHVAGAPVWVGSATSVQVRSDQPASSIRIEALNVEGTATRTSRAARSLRSTAARVLGTDTAAAAVTAPKLRRRAAWNAAPPKFTPEIADSALGVVVHHTASTNAYRCAQVPAMLRGFQSYHMRSNGWNDIGYNYLIDRCGGLWEGRAGGLAKAVIGAHSSGFNTSTVGVSLIGTFGATRPTVAARRTLQRFISWRMDLANVSPIGTMQLTARTSDKYPLGSSVRLPVVSGHRDVFPTSCPGAMVTRELRAMSRAALPQGGIKVHTVTSSYTLADEATGTLGSVTVRGLANQKDARMRIRIERRSDGAMLQDASLRGSVISTVWTPPAGAAPTALWDVRVRVDATSAAGQLARTADRSLGFWAPAPGFEVVQPPAPSVHPGGDPINDQLRVGYSLRTPARVGAWFYDPATKLWVATAVRSRQEPATLPGEVRELVVAVPAALPDGAYELRVGNEDDRAPSRSMRRYSVVVAREA